MIYSKLRVEYYFIKTQNISVSASNQQLDCSSYTFLSESDIKPMKQFSMILIGSSVSQKHEAERQEMRKLMFKFDSCNID